MGGCIAVVADHEEDESSFLPVWEGVSEVDMKKNQHAGFPPCMGGCIVQPG